MTGNFMTPLPTDSRFRKNDGGTKQSPLSEKRKIYPYKGLFCGTYSLRETLFFHMLSDFFRY